MKRRLISSDEAIISTHQHTYPCSDCPWTRDSLPGWLGGISIEEWISIAHSDEMIECHTVDGPQCAGSSIYRANVCKSSRNPDVLKLSRNTVDVFGSPMQFEKHHTLMKS